MTPATPRRPGQALRVLREESGLTAREIAERAGVSESYLSRVERGLIDPAPAWLANVATAISGALVEAAVERERIPAVAS